ncbi:hypothetical protein ACIGLI_15820 [Bacillus subtilis]|uniref:hypothetical protein n=1 Tax=Bacillus TaxID=1386 RepID=UPI000D0E2836|nr:hypothetical protein [Bacillus subtilis]MBJ3768128.1 hypothetical protein [Bacillus subtilis]MDI6686108.1 hypothetical protein [Bacillus subtilis]MED4459748.1 hypothetical protein [Bacillus subtilis]PSL96928.1 hypothetical protein C7T97_21340 [Bacillus subtilis]RMD53290.1 hypothetical protein D3Z89_19270 [Bacillus subtilis]
MIPDEDLRLQAYNTATKHNITTAMVHEGLYQLSVSGCCPWQDTDIVEALGYLGDYGLHNLLAVERIARISEIHPYSRVKGSTNHSYGSLGINKRDDNGELIAPKLLWKENFDNKNERGEGDAR